MSSRKRCCVGNVNIKWTAGWEKGIKLCCGLVRCLFKTTCITRYSISKTQDSLESKYFNFFMGLLQSLWTHVFHKHFSCLLPGWLQQTLGHQGQLGHHLWILCFPIFLKALWFILIKGKSLVEIMHRVWASWLYRGESLFSSFITWTIACSSKFASDFISDFRTVWNYGGCSGTVSSVNGNVWICWWWF